MIVFTNYKIFTNDNITNDNIYKWVHLQMCVFTNDSNYKW